jgi:hypothetical protein
MNIDDFAKMKISQNKIYEMLSKRYPGYGQY